METDERGQAGPVRQWGSGSDFPSPLRRGKGTGRSRCRRLGRAGGSPGPYQPSPSVSERGNSLHRGCRRGPEGRAKGEGSSLTQDTVAV